MVRQPGLMTRFRNFERVRQIAEVAVRHGFGYFFERHNLWDLVPIHQRRSAEMPQQRGRHIREMLEELGPTFVKFGQLLSTRPDLVPADIIEELVKLQDQVPPIPFEAVRTVVEAELGLTLERLFEHFEPESIAAASIGQVHRATLPGGSQVVVKVQRPTAPTQIEQDIDLFYQLANLVKARAGARLFVDPVRVVDEFAISINQEVDYLQEARHAERLAENFVHSDEVVIPRTHWRYCTKRVLTMEMIEGPTVNSLDLEVLPLEQRRILAETITRAWFKQILVDGLFHADPHPGNIVVIAPTRIGLLDFGVTGSLSPEDMDHSVELFRAIVGQDQRAVKRHLRGLGLHWPFDQDARVTKAIDSVFERYYGATLAELNPTAILRELVDLIYALHLELPTRFLLLQKAVMTLEGVVSWVYVDLDLLALARPYARALVLRRYRPDTMLEGLVKSMINYREAARDLPAEVHNLLEMARAGDLRLKFVHAGLEDLTHKLDLVANRVVVAVIVAALAVASALMAAFIQSGPQFLGVSIWGIPGFVIAMFFGIWLLWAIVRSGRL
jgi:ubiquinone biosynthesis protein